MAEETPSAGGGSIGTARIDVTVNTATMEAGVEAAKRKVSGLGTQAAAEFDKANASTKRYADSLLRQAELLGKSRAEQIAYNAQTRIGGQLGDEIARKALANQAKLAAGMGVTAKSAKELQFAMRQVPAQITDIVTGLASGQRPMMVLLQQGGQLKDVFGGIKPAAAALGRSLLGLVNPFTVTAAAAAALFVAWKEGSDEAVAYNKAITATGNYAGQTAGHLSALASSISATTDATQHAVADSLAKVAASGKFTAGQLETVGRAAVAMSTLTGQATDETIRQFEEIGKKPVDAILKLNDAQHFLTQETYAQIKALDDQGRSQEAAALAMKTYSDSLQDRAKEVVDNAGTMERAWHSVSTAAKQAWDAMLDVGRPEGDDDKLGRLQREANAAAIALQNLQKNGPQGGGFGSLNLEGKYYYDSQLKQAKDRAAATLKAYRDEEKRQEAESQKARADALKARLTQDRADSDREAAGYFTNAQKRAQEYLKAENEFNERIARAMKAGDSALAERERQQKVSVLAGINAKYEDKSAAKQAAAFSSPILDTADQAKISQDYAASVYKRLEADKAAMTQQAQNVVSLNQYKAAMDARIATDREAAQLQVESIGLSQHQIELRQQVIQIQREADRDLERLNHDFADKSMQMTREDYDARLKVIKEGEAERIRIVYAADKQVTAAMGDWSLGAQKAISEFERAGADVAGQIHDAFSSAFDGLGDALAKFVTTGKLDFSELANSVIADLARMEARILISQALQSIFGSGGYGGTNGQGGVTYNSQGFVSSVYAKGGVVDGSRNLSAYSGSVIDRPTLFAFAKGNGLMGEAGPEAIMPLRRGPDGKLGVAASGGGSGDVNVEINFTNNSGQSVQPRQTGTRRDGQKVIVDMVLDAVAGDIANGGKTAKAMQQRFGVQRRGVPVGGA